MGRTKLPKFRNGSIWTRIPALSIYMERAGCACLGFRLKGYLSILTSSLPWFQIEELLKTILTSSLPRFQIGELLKTIIMTSSLPWFQIEELLKTMLTTSLLPLFQIEQLLQTE